MAGRLRWSRLCAGEYRATYGEHYFYISHFVQADSGDGYGRRDDWRMTHTGPNACGGLDWAYCGDPDWTYAEAKQNAEQLLEMVLNP